MTRLTRALLGAVVLAVAGPGAAQAATITVHDTASSPPHAFSYKAASGEANNLRYSEAADGTTIISDSAPLRIVGESSLSGCRFNSAGDVLCAPNVRPSGIELGDGNDVVRYQASESLGLLRFGGGLEAGAGNDTIFAGIRRNPDGVLFIDGGSGTADKVTYAEAPSGVTASLDGQSNDGIFNGDKQNVFAGVEQLEGSKSGDRLDGSNADHREVFTGGTGLDILNGLGGTDVFREGPVANGSDDINGGDGIDLVDYSERSVGVLIDHDFAFDDGQLGEEDLVDPSVEDIFGSKVADVITTRFNTGPNVVRGFGGDDTIRTGGGNDTLDGGTGVDTLLGEDGDDTLDANDNTADVLRCGTGTDDTLNADLRDDDATGCETINLVGRLALAAKGANVRLSWTHPVSWKQLRHVTLRVKDGRKVAGKVVIKPRAEKIAASGQVEIARSKLTRKGGKVTARLKLRYDAALAGKRLKADVVAADIHGVKQVERNAATLMVAR
jgi:RTX calcium-binding nonapeptide repeat (4 copies)